MRRAKGEGVKISSVQDIVNLKSGETVILFWSRIPALEFGGLGVPVVLCIPLCDLGTVLIWLL